jgi:hypothetical protein
MPIVNSVDLSSFEMPSCYMSQCFMTSIHVYKLEALLQFWQLCLSSGNMCFVSELLNCQIPFGRSFRSTFAKLPSRDCLLKCRLKKWRTFWMMQS